MVILLIGEITDIHHCLLGIDTVGSCLASKVAYVHTPRSRRLIWRTARTSIVVSWGQPELQWLNKHKRLCSVHTQLAPQEKASVKSWPALTTQGEMLWLCLPCVSPAIVLWRQGFLWSFLGLLAGHSAAGKGLVHFCSFPSQADLCVIPETQSHSCR